MLAAEIGVATVVLPHSFKVSWYAEALRVQAYVHSLLVQAYVQSLHCCAARQIASVCFFIVKKKGAKEVYVFITHAVLSGDASKKIKNSKIKKLIITDSIDNSNKIKNNNKIEVLDTIS